MSQAIAACVLALKTFIWPELNQWQGLPECNLAAVQAALHVPEGDWRGSGYLGESHHPRSWLSASGAGFPDSIRVWLDGERVVALDSKLLMSPEHFPGLLVKLGEPAAKLDFIFANVELKAGEWVYPERGLTLFMNPENGYLLRVAAYPKTTLEHYRKDLRIVFARPVR